MTRPNRSHFLSLSILLAACSPAEQQLPNITPPDAGAPPPVQRISDGFRSGTRISLLYAQDVPPPNAGRGFLPAQFPVSLWDNMLQAPCRVALTSDGRRRCIPDAAETSGYFADNNCTMRLYTGGSCAEPKLYVQDYAGCAAVISKAEPADPSVFFAQSGNTCVSVSPPSSQAPITWYLRGKRIADADLAEIGLLIGRPG